MQRTQTVEKPSYRFRENRVFLQFIARHFRASGVQSLVLIAGLTFLLVLILLIFLLVVLFLIVGLVRAIVHRCSPPAQECG